MRRALFIRLLAVASLLAGCGDDDAPESRDGGGDASDGSDARTDAPRDGDTGDPDATRIVHHGRVEGVVMVAMPGQPSMRIVRNSLVQVNGVAPAVTARTDDDGRFVLDGVPTGQHVLLDVMPPDREGDAEAILSTTQIPVEVHEDETSRTLGYLLEGCAIDVDLPSGDRTPVGFTPSCVERTGTDVRVDLPTEGLVHADSNRPFEGRLRVDMVGIGDRFTDYAAMPGNLSSMQAGRPLLLEAYGGVEVRLYDAISNAALQIAEGSAAKVQIRRPNFGEAAGNLSYVYEPVLGEYQPEVRVTETYLDGPPYHEMFVEHFTWRSVGRPVAPGCLTTRALGADGNPLANTMVRAIGLTTGSVSTAYSDESGVVACLEVPADADILIESYDLVTEAPRTLLTRRKVRSGPDIAACGECTDVGMLGGAAAQWFDPSGAVWDPTCTPRTPTATCTSTDEDCNFLGEDEVCDCTSATLGHEPNVYCEPEVTMRLGDSITLSPGYSDDCNIASFQWTMLDREPGSSANVDTPTAASTEFTPDIGGAYTLGFVATDNEGLESLSCATLVRVRAPGSEPLRVELTWSQPNDLDLHLAQNAPGSVWFSGTTDTYYNNPSPGWASLDADDVSRVGPENIYVFDPMEGDTYRVGVHYFTGASRQDVLVRIYCGDALPADGGTLSTVLEAPASGVSRPFLRVADITMTADGCTVDAIDEVTTETEARGAL